MPFGISKKNSFFRWLVINACVSLIILVGVSGISLAASTKKAQQITWKDLVPPIEIYNDPFLNLTPDQKFDLILVTRTKQLQSEGASITPEQLKRFKTSLKRLENDRIDIDGLLAKRGEIVAKQKQAAEAVNATLNNQQVRLAGYVLPLEMDGLKVKEFLLVPYVGACIHEPTPPPNQIVLVKFERGIEVNGQFTPVWVEGEMLTQMSKRSLYLADGSTDVPNSYTLDAGSVELYRK